VPALLCLLVQLPSTRAQAQTAQPVDLEWTAPADCPRLEDVQAKIRKLTGTRKWSAVPLRAEAIVVRKDDTMLHLRLVLHAGEMIEERNIDGSSCNALAGATAVVVALMLRSGGLPPTDGEQAEPSATGEQAAEGSASGHPSGVPPTAAREPSPPDVAPADRTPAPSAPKAGARRRWHALAQLPVGVVSIGPLPTPSLGVAAAGGASVDRWRFLARGTAWLSQHSPGADEFEPYGARTRRTSLTLLGCRSLFASRFEISPCASVSLSHLSARGEGEHIAPRTATATWVAAGLGLHARFHVVSWMSLVLSADGEFGTSRPRFVVDGVGQVQALAPGAATFGLGTEWIL
jgi:hypothetical protein